MRNLMETRDDRLRGTQMHLTGAHLNTIIEEPDATPASAEHERQLVNAVSEEGVMAETHAQPHTRHLRPWVIIIDLVSLMKKFTIAAYTKLLNWFT